MGQALPVIVSFGGVNSAGRSSMHHGYARMVESALGEDRRRAMIAALRQLTGSNNDSEASLLERTLIRRIGPAHFDPNSVAWNQRLPTRSNGSPVSFELHRRYLPEPVPDDWKLLPGEDEEHVRVQIVGEQQFLLPTHREFEVKVASQLPDGFDPASLYQSRNHPRGLAMSVYAASDALGNLGMDWDSLMASLGPDQISVYAGSAMGQLDDNGAGGMLKARYRGSRVTSKFCPLGLAEMPADFVNAYVLGAAGSTGATLGACASFLYNLRHAIHDIRAGRARVAFVGAAEAPVTPEVMEGYAAMGALATDKGLRQLDGLGDTDTPDHRRACRPFGENCGFTIGESSQFLVLFDDKLALETGANILGAAADVFINADGFKKSISGPGVGNYLTMARAAACARAIVGEQALREGGLVQAHGTGTPQNRVTESVILSRVAGAFGIQDWPVGAIKSYVGHSLAAASGDQIAATLGIWSEGWMPGITTTDALADDVATENLSFSLEHRALDLSKQRYALINAKGFGGNNASATILSPLQTMDMLKARHGAQSISRWEQAQESVKLAQESRESRVLAGEESPRYLFDNNVLGDEAVSFDGDGISIADQRVSLVQSNPFAD
ncbi:beta-ketoacyl synthase [Congregibacter brevis]|uniref:Beta-ketoacyl synthase n=1 Tax=Congregibacter brevis TaxID=3081201 RepID=A0ABZ0I9W7_9GAMM|nr:beta-ketoacyl synthase [Congregibacter sp. IMCC45268]